MSVSCVRSCERKDFRRIPNYEGNRQAASSSRNPRGGTGRREVRAGDLKDEVQREKRKRGSRTDSSQKRRAGARGWSSREFEAENRRYLDREVERRVREQLQCKRERCEQGRGQDEEGCQTRKEGILGKKAERVQEASYRREVRAEAGGRRAVGSRWYRRNLGIPPKQSSEDNMEKLPKEE